MPGCGLRGVDGIGDLGARVVDVAFDRAGLLQSAAADIADWERVDRQLQLVVADRVEAKAQMLFGNGSAAASGGTGRGGGAST